MNLVKLITIQTLIKLRPAILASLIKKLIFPNREVVETQNGTFEVDIASNFGYQLLTGGVYEQSLVKTLQNYLKPGDIFIDLGANEGYFSVIASQIVGETGRVIAIEPQLRLQPILHRNFNLNSCNNAKVLPVAVSDKSGKASVHLSSNMNTGSSSLVQSTVYPLSKQEVVTTTLSEIFQQEDITNCGMIKIDIEGWEYEAIMGSLEIFRKHRIKVVALELHPQILSKRGLSAKNIIDCLIGLGFTLNESCGNTVFVC